METSKKNVQGKYQISQNRRSCSLDRNCSNLRIKSPKHLSKKSEALNLTLVSGIQTPAKRTRLLSDTYFEIKNRQKSLERTSNKGLITKNPEASTEYNYSVFVKIRFYLQQIIENFEKIRENYRDDEKNIYLCLAVAVRYKEKQNFEDRIQEEINSDEFKSFFVVFARSLTIEVCKNFDLMLNLEKAFKIYLLIPLTLYGFTLTKSIYNILAIFFKLKGLVYRPLKFIDYFEDSITFAKPEKKQKKPKKVNKKFEEFFTQEDEAYETTKEDIYLNTEAYEESFQYNEAPISYTEPDSKDRLITKFYSRFRLSNPYDFNKNSFRSSQSKYK